MQFRKKPVVIEATQWHKQGDHPQVRPIAPSDDLFFTGMGGATLTNREQYGVIGTLESPNHLVSPGDWIITGVQGERYPCKPDIFAATYEAVEQAPVTPIDQDVVTRVQKIIAQQLNIASADIKIASKFIDDLGADSLDEVEIVMALEDEFAIVIPDDEADKIKTVQQAVAYIVKHKGEGA
jgi:acyl carrier protein